MLVQTRSDEVVAVQTEFDQSAHDVCGQEFLAAEDADLQDLLTSALFRRLRAAKPQMFAKRFLDGEGVPDGSGSAPSGPPAGAPEGGPDGGPNDKKPRTG